MILKVDWLPDEMLSRRVWKLIADEIVEHQDYGPATRPGLTEAGGRRPELPGTQWC
jgi:hypothetical protein